MINFNEFQLLFRFVFRPNCLHSSKNRKLMNYYTTLLRLKCSIFRKNLLSFVNRAVFSNGSEIRVHVAKCSNTKYSRQRMLSNVVVSAVNMPSDDDTSDAKVSPSEWNIFVFVQTHTHNTRIRIIKHFILAKHLSCRHIPYAATVERLRSVIQCEKDFGRWNVKSMSVSRVRECNEMLPKYG